jgi:hypothetical protein
MGTSSTLVNGRLIMRGDSEIQPSTERRDHRSSLYRAGSILKGSIAQSTWVLRRPRYIGVNSE